MEKEAQEVKTQVLLLETVVTAETEAESIRTDMRLMEMMGKKVRMELWF